MTDLAFNVAKRPRAGLRTLILVVLLGLSSVTASRPAEAREVVHQVQKGQYLDLIARRYHTTAAAIAKRNGLRPGKMLKPGDKLVIIETDEHRQWREAVERATGKRVKEHEHQPDPPKPAPAKPEPAKAAPRPKAPPPKAVPVDAEPAKVEARDDREITSAKRRPSGTPTQAQPEEEQADGKPAATSEVPAAEPAPSPPAETYAKAPKRPGYVHLIRYGERFVGQLVAPNGRVSAKASQRVDRLLRSLRTGKQAKIDRRLLNLLAQVSDHFGGRTIEIVSGFRPYSEKQYTRNSRHNHGEAVDFRVVGVPTEVVFEHCRKFANVGCGYYPNSGFVHMDVRKRKTQWTDYSRPGQPPKYAHRQRQGGRKAKRDGQTSP